MHKPKQHQKQIAIVIGAGIALYLLYRWYSSNSTPSTTQGGSSPADSTQYAALAGQEQSDVANLQRQLDHANLVDAGQSKYIAAINARLKAQRQHIAKLAAGEAKLNRAQHVTIKPNSPFAKYYQKVTGKQPPTTLLATNLIWQAFKAGISATKLRQDMRRAGNQNNAHPNPDHQRTEGKGLKPRHLKTHDHQRREPVDRNSHRGGKLHANKGTKPSGTRR